VQVEKPHLGQNPLTPVVALLIVGTLGLLAWKLYNAEFMRYLWLWALGVLVVFWFSVSGGMHNIIRGVPFMYVDQSGKLNLFMGSGQGQLGAEGFMMGGLYTLFGLSITGMTYLGTRIKDKTLQRALCYGLLGLAFVAFGSLSKTHSAPPSPPS
jgi:oligosaccharyltransferase complex subunit gamma